MNAIKGLHRDYTLADRNSVVKGPHLMPTTASNTATDTDYNYQQAHQAAMDFIEEKKANSRSGHLYATWTQHVGTCGRVCEVFHKRLGELGVGAGSERSRELFAQFQAAHGLGDNYLE